MGRGVFLDWAMVAYASAGCVVAAALTIGFGANAIGGTARKPIAAGLLAVLCAALAVITLVGAVRSFTTATRRGVTLRQWFGGTRFAWDELSELDVTVTDRGWMIRARRADRWITIVQRTHPPRFLRTAAAWRSGEAFDSPPLQAPATIHRAWAAIQAGRGRTTDRG